MMDYQKYWELNPTMRCVTAPYPVSSIPTNIVTVVKLAMSGAAGSESLASRQLMEPSTSRHDHWVFEQMGTDQVKPVQIGSFSPIAGAFIETSTAPPRLDLRTLVDPHPPLEIRIRAIYAIDKGSTPRHSLEHVRAVVSGLVEAANRDLSGTGLRFITFKYDVEIIPDTQLRCDVVLPADVLAKLKSGVINEQEGKKIIGDAARSVQAHRNKEAEKKPNTLLWLFSRGNRFEVVRDPTGKFLHWDYFDDRQGSFSGDDNKFVALHDGFLNSVQGAKDDASRAVHETGHYFGLWHTHHEPFHDLNDLKKAVESDPEFARIVKFDPKVLNGSPTERFTAWRKAVAAWLDAQLPNGASSLQAKETYDVDRGSNVLDTPPDPGAGIMALANEVEGHGSNELGPVATITLNVPGVSGSVDLTPLRNNPMGYYLRETPNAMKFTGDQIKRIRNNLINGTRRPLVAAQLGDTATPEIQVCAVWSPNAQAQRLVWGWGRDDFIAENQRMAQAGMVLTHQQSYTLKDKVLYDGIWDVGTQPQKTLMGWLKEHVLEDLPKRKAKGMLPVAVQGYQHLNDGIRYNVIYESATGAAQTLLGITQDELSNAWGKWMPKGYRMTCLSSHVDQNGVVRYSTVFRKTGKAQSWIAGWTLDDMAKEYGKRWNEGWRIQHIAVVKAGNQHLWSAVFEPDQQNQLVYWKHVRERILEVYGEMWATDFKLRTMCAVFA